MKLPKRLFVVLFLLYVSGLPNRLGFISFSLNEVISMFFSLTGLLALAIYLPKNRYHINNIDFFLLLLLFIFPFLSSITAWFIIGQPIYMGLLTFRSSFILLTYYTFTVFGVTDENIIDSTTGIVIFILITIAILFYVFGINDFNLLFRKGTIVVKYGRTITKGLQFSGFTCLFIVPYLVGWVRFFEKNRLKFLFLPIIILAFEILVVKARNEILTLAVVPLMMYYLKYRATDVKFLLYTLFLVSGFFLILLTDNAVSRNFSGLIQPASYEHAYSTGDYSAYLRIEEIKAGWKWFVKYPFTGVGSASYRFNNGYMGFISDFFFIADIGIVGILVKGGIFLVLLYIFMYSVLFNSFRHDDLVSVIGRYISLALLIELIIGNDFLFNYTGVFVILFLLKKRRERGSNKESVAVTRQ
jgi:hypothetical protein